MKIVNFVSEWVSDQFLEITTVQTLILHSAWHTEDDVYANDDDLDDGVDVNDDVMKMAMSSTKLVKMVMGLLQSSKVQFLAPPIRLSRAVAQCKSYSAAEE